MATKYLALLTNIGAAKLAKATALGTKVEITQLAVGDGNGVLPTPNPAQTALVHELRRAPLNMLTVDPANASQIIAEQVIPEDVGGWWIREIGLFDKDGDMVAIANCAETYKPQLQEGSGRVQVIRVILIVSSTEAVTLKIDPAVVLATRQYVDSQLRAHEQSRNHPDASTTEKGFVQLSSSVTSDSESQGATPKAVKIAMDNASARLAKDRNLSDLPNIALARQNLELGDSSTRNVGTTAGTVASGDDARITGAMQKNQNGADIPDVAKFLQNLGLIGGVIPNKIGRLVNIKIINTSGTYTRSPQATFGYVEVIGAGGAGAGSPGINNTTDINYSVVGSGGGAGAYAFKFYQELPVTAPVIVGVGGQATYATGNPGGASSFNSSIVAYGGAGGSYIGAYYTNSVITNVRGPSGGSAVGGDINAAGEMGGSCFVSNNLNIVSGKGGASKLGSGGISVGGGSANGVPSSTPGGGGSGAVSSRYSLVAAPAQLGGAGANGIVIVWEFA